MNPRRNKCTFCEHFFVGSDVSPVFLTGVESICAMLPYRQLLDTYDLLEVFLAHIVLDIGQSSLKRRIQKAEEEPGNKARRKVEDSIYMYRTSTYKKAYTCMHVMAIFKEIPYSGCICGRKLS